MSSVRKNQFGQEIGPALPGWAARQRPPPAALIGRYGRVQPVHPERDCDALFAAYGEAPDERDWTYLSVNRPQSAEQCREYLERLAASQDPLHFTITDAATGGAVGTAALMRMDPQNGVIEVGSIAFSPVMKRSRIGTEAMYLLMRCALEDLRYRRYEWKCDSLNAASRSAALRYGFTYEGIFRQAVVYKERSRDTAWYSILDEEWPATQRAFEGWLDPANFDETGRQRRSLAQIRREVNHP